MPSFVPFISYILLTSFTPGPANIMSMTNAGQVGYKKAIPFTLGIGVGFFIIACLCMLFGATLSSLMPTAAPYLKILGAVYILWLAVKTFLNKPKKGGTKKANCTFLTGITLELLNPKAILYCITVTTTFITPYYTGFIPLAIFTIGLSLVCFSALTCWALFGSIFQRFYLKHMRVVNTIMALLLVYCAVSLFL